MFGYILIVVITACGSNTCREYPAITMQRFNDAKACQFASAQLNILAEQRIKAVCVPEGTK